MHFRPSLRKDIELHPREGGSVGIADPVACRVVEAGRITRAVVERLDGTRPVGQLLDEVATGLSVERPEVEHTVRNLLLLSVVEGAGTSILERLRGLQRGERPLKPVFLPETRFACQGSGQCCQIYDLGPLGEDDVKQLASLDIAKAYPKLGPGPYTEEKKEKDGATDLYLRSDAEGRCIFLQTDNRCGIHAVFGAQAKPSMCRLFPWKHMTTLEGLVIFDRAQCATFATSARAGTSLEDELPAIVQLLPKHVRFYHPVVVLDDKTRCDYGHVLELRRALCDLAGREEGTAGSTLRAVAGRARDFASGLAACPLESGQPEATVASVLARSVPAPRRTATRDELWSVATVCAALLTNEARTPLTRQAAEVLRMIEALARHRADPGKTTCPDWILRVASVPADDPEVDAVMRLSFRKYAFGDNLLIEDRLRGGLLRLAFVYLVTLVGAKLRAMAEGAPRVRPEHLSHPHMVVGLTLRKEGLEKTLVAEERHAWDVLQAAPSLVEVAQPAA